MLSATNEAKTAALPVVFDPVGAGASDYHTHTCKQIIAENTPTVADRQGRLKAEVVSPR